QAEGNMEEAVFLMRAHRSTLPRLYYSTITDTREMFVERRVSASFKDIPGGQILGASPDFTHRLLDDALKEVADGPSQEIEYKENNDEPDDITKRTLELPSTRIQRLQGLPRGQAGAVTSLGYAEIRGYGIASHPIIGECRVGQQPVCVDFEDGYAEYFIGYYEL